MTKFWTNSSGAIWWPNLQPIQVVPLKSTLNYTKWKIYSRYGVNTLGPLCLWQCFLGKLHHSFQVFQLGHLWLWFWNRKFYLASWRKSLKICPCSCKTWNWLSQSWQIRTAVVTSFREILSKTSLKIWKWMSRKSGKVKVLYYIQSVWMRFRGEQTIPHLNSWTEYFQISD